MSVPAKIDIAASHVGTVGCSEIARAMNLSAHGTAYQLWRVKTGLDQPEDIGSELRVALGTPMEDVLRPFVAAKLGRELRRDNREFRHPTLPLIGHVDYRASALNGEQQRPVVDMKTSLGWGARHRFGEDGTDEVDQDVFMQMQGYLLLTGAETAYVAALVPGPELKIYTIQADPELHQMIADALTEFWWHVDTNTPPPITTLDDCKLRWPKSSGATVQATADQVSLVENLIRMKDEIKAKQEIVDAGEMEIKFALGDAEALIGLDGKPIYTWKNQEDTRLDNNAIKADGLYEKYTRTKTIRVFRPVKPKKGKA